MALFLLFNDNMKATPRFVLAALVAAGLSVHKVHASQLTLAWDAPTRNEDETPLTNLAGYRVRVGLESGGYAQSIDVGNVTTHTVTDLDEGQTYFFTVSAYNSDGVESDPAGETSGRVPDSTAPVLSGPSTETMESGLDGSLVLPQLTDRVTATDNVTPSDQLVMTQSPAAGTVLGLGSTDIRITVADADGNQSVHTLALVVQMPNQAPTVAAGSDVDLRMPSPSTVLAATIADDGLPDGAGLVLTWSVVSGPAGVAFGDRNSASTVVTFPAEGSYVLRMTARDGELSGSDDLTVTVLPPPKPQPPQTLRIVG